MLERIRLTRFSSPGPLPKPTYDDVTVALYVDAADAPPRPVPPGATAVVSVLEKTGELDGTGEAAACLEVVVGEGPGPCCDHPAFSAGALYRDVTTDAVVFLGRWASWPDLRAHRLHHPIDGEAWHLPAHDHARSNRTSWNARADEYQSEHVFDLSPERRWSFAPFVTQHSARPLLGDVVSRRVLELGCGGGQLGGDLAAEGAEVVGLDLSRGQLRHAAALMPVVEADGEVLPFAPGSFDLVFCSFGAIGGFTEVRRVLREVARVLTPGGRAVWSWTGPLFNALGDDFGSTAIERSYFDRTPWIEEGGEYEFALLYEDWVEAIAGAGLRLDRLHEPQPDLQRWQEGSWQWWSRERTSVLPTVVIWEVTRP